MTLILGPDVLEKTVLGAHSRGQEIPYQTVFSEAEA